MELPFKLTMLFLIKKTVMAYDKIHEIYESLYDHSLSNTYKCDNMCCFKCRKRIRKIYRSCGLLDRSNRVDTDNSTKDNIVLQTYHIYCWRKLITK